MIVDRRDATQATLLKFSGKTFDWRERATCVHMVRWHLAKMGHAVPPVPDFRSAKGALAVLKRKGWEDLAAMVDSVLPRIPYAMALPGDVVQLPGDGPFPALCIRADNGRVFGYFEGGAFAVMQPHEIVAAWRA